MQYPKISIVTPSFNQAIFLERTILSVVNQNYPNLEYIIIDGGSIDDSVEIIKKYEKYLAYWISEKDSGQSEAINKGFKKATGEIFAYLNSDDIYQSNTLNYIADFFNNNRLVDILYGQAILINENDLKIGFIPALPFRLKELLNGVFSIPQQSAFWRKHVFEKLLGFNENNHTCMDGEFFARAAYHNFKFKKVNVVLASFRIHKNSKTSDKSSQKKILFQKDRLAFISELSSKAGIQTNRGLELIYRIKYIPIKLYHKIFH